MSKVNINDLIKEIKELHSKYEADLAHSQACSQLLEEAIESGEFTVTEIEDLGQIISERSKASEAVMKSIEEKITSAQKSWRDKAELLKSLEKVLGPESYKTWTARHEKLADELDALIDLLSGNQ